MLEIVGVISLIIWFAKTAKENGKNMIFWGLIGGISFYLPIFIMSYLIFPFAISLLEISVDLMARFSLIVLNVIVAILGVLLGMRILNYYIDKDMSKTNKKLPLTRGAANAG